MGPRARAAAEQAVRANPTLSEAQHVSGQVQWFFEWDFGVADAAFRQAVSLDPSNAWAHSMFGHALSQLGRHDEAARIMDKACMLEPLSSLHHAMASQVAFQARDLSRALEHARRAIVIDPEFWVGHMMRGQVCEQLDETDLALDAVATAARLSGGNSKPIALRGYLLARLGDTGAAQEVLALLEDVARRQYVPPYTVALVHAGLKNDEYGVQLARARIGRSRRPSDFPACRSEVGCAASRASLRVTARAVWLRPCTVTGKRCPAVPVHSDFHDLATPYLRATAILEMLVSDREALKV